jgi:3-isopropylmalate/(R)-2-methylmalate dehydratase small subunit
VIVAPGAARIVEHGDEIEVDLENGLVRNCKTGKTVQSSRLPDFVMGILSDGGLIAHLKKKIREGKTRGG